MSMRKQPHWLIRGIGSAVMTPIILVSLVAVALFSAEQSSLGSTDRHQAAVILFALAAVAAGCVALAWVRPQRAGLSPPHVMLSLGFGGMLLGLLYDAYNTGPARLDSLCAQASSLGLMDSLQLHVQFLPAMHAGMLTGGLLAIPGLRMLRHHCGRYLCSLFAQNLMCSGWMLAGMTAGALWLSRWQFSSGTSTLPGMLGGMFVGMTWGMVVSVSLYRGGFFLRDRIHSKKVV